MTPEQFTALATRIPYSPRSQNATGLLAPLVRSMGHILFLLGVTATETETGPALMTGEEKQNELDHAKIHIPPLDEIVISPVLSAGAKTNILTYATLISELQTEWSSWSYTSQIETLRTTANAAAGLAASFDRELVGLHRDLSDPGTSL